MGFPHLAYFRAIVDTGLIFLAHRVIFFLAFVLFLKMS